MGARIDGFVGSLEQYVSYLEGEIIAIRRQKRSCAGRVLSTPRSDALGNSACDSTNAMTSWHHGSAAQNAEESACEDGSAPSIQRNVKRLKGCSELEFVMLDPGTVTLNPVKARRPMSRWKGNAKALIAQTPKAADWYSTLKEHGIYDVMVTGQAVAYLMGIDEPSAVLSCKAVSSGFTAPDRLKGYALAASQRGSAASTALKLANFQKFLVLSACYVLRQSIGQDCITDIISLCVGRKVTPSRGEDLLKTCHFIHRLLHSISAQGWGLRVCELFLLWDRPPTFFEQLCHAKESSIRFFEGSIGAEEYTKMPETPPHWTSLFVPIFVDHMIGGCIPIDEISEALGYADSHFTRDNPWRFVEEL